MRKRKEVQVLLRENDEELRFGRLFEILLRRLIKKFAFSAKEACPGETVGVYPVHVMAGRPEFAAALGGPGTREADGSSGPPKANSMAEAA